MAHIDLTQITRTAVNPFGFLRTLAASLSAAVEMNQIAQDALSRGQTGDALHETLIRRMRQVD